MGGSGCAGSEGQISIHQCTHMHLNHRMQMAISVCNHLESPCATCCCMITRLPDSFALDTLQCLM